MRRSCMTELMIALNLTEDARSLNDASVAQAADWVPVSVDSQVFASSEDETCNNSSKT